jgi:four helix bundle protein
MHTEWHRVNAGTKSTRGPSVNERSPKVRERSFTYALRAIKLYQYLQKRKDGAGWLLGKQYLRAACSVGANVEEAQAGESRADFVHKLGVAQKEVRESLYWLRLLGESNIVANKNLESLIEETKELNRMLASIILTTKQRSDESRTGSQRSGPDNS